MKQFDKLSRAQREVGRLAQDALADFWRSYSKLPPADFRDALLEFVPALVHDYGKVAAMAAADWYEESRAAQLGGNFTALVESANLEAVGESVRWAAGDLFTDTPAAAKSKLLATVDRNVRNVGRDTITANTRRDPARPRWARVMRGRETCGWCRMLASRGFVYRSRELAGGDHSWGHDSCDCEAIPDFALSATERDAYDTEVDDLYSQYLDVVSRLPEAGLTDSAVAAEWSRSLIDYETVRKQLEKDRKGATSDGTMQQHVWDEHRRRVLERMEREFPDGYVGSRRIPPRNPAQAPADWPKDLPALRAKEWNHLLYGDKNGGGHLPGYGWIHDRPEFEPEYSPEWLLSAAEQVIRQRMPYPRRGRLQGEVDGITVYVALSTTGTTTRVVSIFPRT